MRSSAFILVLAMLPASAASAQNMLLPQFLDKATALEKEGPLALFSSDMKLLKKEMQASATTLRAERVATERAGKKPAYCPPEKQGGLNSDEILSHFRSIPAPQRAACAPATASAA